MALETGTFISDLVPTNPTASDNINEGDDHLRLLKDVLQNTNPGMAGRAYRSSTKNSAYTVLLNDNTTLFDCTATFTLSLTAAATLGNGFIITVDANGGDVTIDPNGAELINGSATITILNGKSDIIYCNGTSFISLGIASAGLSNIVEDTTPQLGGDLDCNGAQIQWSKGADVASATALPVLTDGNYFDVTGTTTVTSINTTGGAGTVIKLHFDGAVLLTHSASLVLPSGANVTTAAGDEFEFTEFGAGTYRCTGYALASGSAVVGGDLVNDTTPQLGGPLDCNSQAINHAPVVVVASSTNPAIGAAASNSISISGTTTIAGFDDIGIGTTRYLVFSGALQLTQSATLVLPNGGSNITTAAADTCMAQQTSTGGGFSWRIFSYQRKDGTALTGGGDLVDDTTPQLGGTLDCNAQAINHAVIVTVASATAPAIGAAASNNISISGTTTIAGFDDISVGVQRLLVFEGALQLTHSATLILPTSANITTVAGDTCMAVQIVTGTQVWRIFSYQRADGTAIATNIVIDTTPQLGGALDCNSNAINHAVHTEAANATTSDIWAGGNTCLLSGSVVTFTDVADAPNAGAVRYVVANAAHIITDNAALEVDGNANYTCVAGDILRFEAKTTSTFRVSVVSHSDTAGGINVNQTYAAAQRGAVTALSSGTNVSIELNTSNNFSLTLATNATLDNPTTTPVAGQSGIIAITQDGTGSRTLAYGTEYVFVGGTDPVLTTGLGLTDLLAYYVISTTEVYISIAKDVK